MPAWVRQSKVFSSETRTTKKTVVDNLLPDPGRNDPVLLHEAWMISVFQIKPDAYQAAMAKWMFKHMAMNQTTTLEEEIATYPETLAWDTWRDVSKRLR